MCDWYEGAYSVEQIGVKMQSMTDFKRFEKLYRSFQYIDLIRLDLEFWSYLVEVCCYCCQHRSL